MAELIQACRRLRCHLKTILMVSVVTFGLVLLNDQVCRPMLPKYDLRLLDHLLAAIYIPYVVSCAIDGLTYAVLYYLAWCTVWEVGQSLGRGYFQWGQYVVDLFGILLVYGLLAYNKEQVGD